MGSEASETLDAALLRRWARAGLDGLAGAREQIDALNVFPVADRDTGTNLYLTMRAAARAVEELPMSADLAATAHALSRGALIGARGNSGGILSQLLSGFAEALTSGREAAANDAGALTAAYLRAADLAYAAVAQPVEGTMLTVARAAAEAVEQRRAPVIDGGPVAPREEAGASIAALASIARSAAEGAWRSLARTPLQLEVLSSAGVVDAGGQGLCVLYDALARALGSEADADAEAEADAETGTAALPDRPRPGDPDPAATREGLGTDGPAYEVTYLLDAPDEAAAQLRDALDRLGDSVLVGGGEGLWTVHAHVDDVGAAVEAGVLRGRPYRIRVIPLIPRTANEGPYGPAPGELGSAARGVVCVVAGDGLAALCASAGGLPLLAEPGRPVSAEQLLEGIRATGAREVVVLPNDAESFAAARTASTSAQMQGLRVAVLPTRVSVQALAALAVHEPSLPFDEDVVAMTSAAAHARSGAVTLARYDAVTTAGPCKAGEALGVIDGDFAVVSSDLASAACEVVDRMLAAGGELVTLMTGADADAGLALTVAAHVAMTHPEVDSRVHHGGQPRYPLLLGVE